MNFVKKKDAKESYEMNVEIIIKIKDIISVREFQSSEILKLCMI